MNTLSIQQNVSLRDRNTFGFEAKALALADVYTDDQLQEALEYADDKELPVLVLGGGSNMVFTRDWPGLVLCPRANSHKSVPTPDSVSAILVTADAGVVWHELVMAHSREGYSGIENLALIPGYVGAAPVQNIGAYGVELADSFVSLRAFHRPTREWLTLTRDDCQFAYRDSLFKRYLDQYVITEVTLRLDREGKLETSYRPLAEKLEKIDRTPTCMDIAEAVIAIRQSKLPDPEVIGNAGSFFKNPVVNEATFKTIQRRYPDIAAFRQPEGRIKLAAGWLIDELGFKGVQHHSLGVHQQQALVITNSGGGTGEQLLQLVGTIHSAVQQEFGIILEVEPRVID